MQQSNDLPPAKTGTASSPNLPPSGHEKPAGTGAPAPSSGGGGITSIIVGVLVLAGIVWAVQHYRTTKDQAAAGGGAGGGKGGGAGLTIPVVAGTVAKKDVPIYLDGLATVQAFNTVTIHARVDGQLKKIGFTEGQDVKAGDLLALIDPDPYQTQVEQNEAKKAQDEAQLANARIQLARDAELLAQKILAQADYDTQKAQADQFDAAVKADQAAIDNAKVQLAYTTINSPIDGRTGIRLVDVGNIVHANDTNGLVVITQLRPISVLLTLPEQTLGSIHKQMTGSPLKVLAVDRDNTSVLGEGELAVIDNQIDTTTGTIKLKATFPNTDLRLWPGQFINGRLLLTTRKDGLVVPASVIQRGPDGSYAFVIKADDTVEDRPVKVVQIQDGQALIAEGLEAGERVVVDGQYKLQRGSHVTITKPADGKGKGSGKGGKKGGGDAAKKKSSETGGDH